MKTILILVLEFTTIFVIIVAFFRLMPFGAKGKSIKTAVKRALFTIGIIVRILLIFLVHEFYLYPTYFMPLPEGEVFEYGCTQRIRYNGSVEIGADSLFYIKRERRKKVFTGINIVCDGNGNREAEYYINNGILKKIVEYHDCENKREVRRITMFQDEQNNCNDGEYPWDYSCRRRRPYEERTYSCGGYPDNYEKVINTYD